MQDAEAVFAAACANVNAGYFDDPPDLPGLAHFLEHAVHLGSAKYPDEKDYKFFLSRHGGASNASTGGQLMHRTMHDIMVACGTMWQSSTALSMAVIQQRAEDACTVACVHLLVAGNAARLAWCHVDSHCQYTVLTSDGVPMLLLAPTGMVHTQYHFKVHHQQLAGALDRLAQFFTEPLLLQVGLMLYVGACVCCVICTGHVQRHAGRCTTCAPAQCSV